MPEHPHRVLPVVGACAGPPGYLHHCRAQTWLSFPFLASLTCFSHQPGHSASFGGPQLASRSLTLLRRNAPPVGTSIFGIRAPLVEAGLSKDDIRALARDLGLPVWDKPAQACLASRIPYGDCITGAKVVQVEAAEEALRRQGFQQLRVRHHGPVARIEVPLAELPRLLDEETCRQVVRDLQAAGFTYVTLDLQ